MYTHYSQEYILFRRTMVVFIGVLTFPIMILTPVSLRGKLYSYLHRYWLKTSTKPVWLLLNEKAAKGLY